MEHLVKLVSFENQIILDPFSGSCSTGVSSLKNKRKFIGYELNDEYYKICKKRMKNIECELSNTEKPIDRLIQREKQEVAETFSELHALSILKEKTQGKQLLTDTNRER
jgi:DNA modification methylase